MERKSSIENRDDFSADLPALDDQFPHAHRQFESPRPRAAGIEIEHSILRLLPGSVAVAINHGIEARGFRLEVELRQIVQDVNRNAAQFEHFRRGQLASQSAGIDIAANRRDRRNGSKFFKDFRIAHVAGVNDAVRIFEDRNSFGPQQSMRVRDDADNVVGFQIRYS
jgi:hypothetical protein